jgi:hypothetical protein
MCFPVPHRPEPATPLTERRASGARLVRQARARPSEHERSRRREAVIKDCDDVHLPLLVATRST